MNNTLLASKRTAYVNSRKANNLKIVSDITARLTEEYWNCQYNPNHTFSMNKILQDLMSPSMILAFKKAAIKRRVLVERPGNKVTYRTLKDDFIAAPNDMRTISFIQEASLDLKEQRANSLIVSQSTKSLLEEILNRISNN